MPDLVNQLASQTGISADLIHKGVGALLSFMKKELGDQTFSEVESSVPNAANALKTFETSAEPGESQGGLLGMVTGLAGKLLGGKTGEGAELIATFSKLGFKPEQIESFIPKALELIKTYLSPELLQKILAALPALAAMIGSGAKNEA